MISKLNLLIFPDRWFFFYTLSPLLFESDCASAATVAPFITAVYFVGSKLEPAVRSCT